MPHSVPPRPGRALSITPAGVLGTLALLVVVAICVRLGFWQLARLEQRRAQNEAVAARLVAPAVSDPAALADTAGLFYRSATLHGIYDTDRSVVLPGRSHRGVPGVHLLTPLRLDDRADAVLVNRGWVPSADAATIDVADFRVTDPVAVHGLVLPFPGAAESLAQRGTAPQDDGFRQVWYTVDEARLRAQYPYPLLPVTVQELPEAAGSAGERARYPTRLEPPPLDEGPHLGYALQWFSFALIGVIGWLALLLRSRVPPRAVAPPTAALLALLAGPAAPAAAQLRPLDPMDWRIFDAGVSATGEVGAGLLSSQPAPLAGTRGTLLEGGIYGIAVRSGRIAVAVGGTAVWRLTGEVQETVPVGNARPPDGRHRQDAGPAFASTLFRVSPDRWPLDLVLRFGATIPTTSDETGLERDRTDMFALLAARFRTGRFSLHMEHGIGINGTVFQDYPQSDVWSYALGGAVEQPGGRLVFELVGREDGHDWRVRGNEDQREVRAGVDLGRTRFLRLRYIYGLSDFSPAHGLRLSGGFAVGGRR